VVNPTPQQLDATCSAADVNLSVDVDRPAYPVGAVIGLTTTIRNHGNRVCTFRSNGCIDAVVSVSSTAGLVVWTDVVVAQQGGPLVGQPPFQDPHVLATGAFGCG